MASSRVIFKRIDGAYRWWVRFREVPVRACATVLVVVACAGAGPARAQNLSAPLPLDMAIETGSLPNGLRYFVREHPRPANRVMLRLVVKAGSTDEADDQRGLAHVLEHMAFNGTTHFRPGELVEYLESIGSQFGPHVNAYTNFDETVYMLDVPTDRPGALARGMEALSDFAGGMTLDPAEIDRERGVVIEEWRGRLGAGTRMQDAQLKALFGVSRYIDRLPIGTPEVLKSFSPQRLRDFYRAQYRADRMAVVVVGDIDQAEAERLVHAHFTSLPSLPPSVRAPYEIPPHDDTRYVAVSDQEAQASRVSVTFKRPREPFRSSDDYRRTATRSLVHQMLNARFREMARSATAPFLQAASGNESLGRTVEGFSLSARVEDGQAARGLEALGEEVARLRLHGFGEAELARAKVGLLTSYERAFKERDNVESDAYASELVRHYLTEEAVPGIGRELELIRGFLPMITTREAAGLVRSLLRDDNRVVLALSPEKPGLPVMTEALLRDALRSGTTATMAAWRDDVAGRALLTAPITPGTLTSRRAIPEIGVTVLRLSNGVEVWLKPTDFRNDQIVFSSYAKGGLSLASEPDYLNAALATSFVSLAGIGGFTPVDLGKLLTGRSLSASPYASSYNHGVNGSAAPKDLETALQLVYLTFTVPNQDSAAFELMKRRLEANLANQGQSPGAVFGERVRRINTLDHYSVTPVRLDDIPRLDLERMLGFYRSAFANAANFTFFFAGTFTIDGIAPLVTTYLGALPSRGAADSEARDQRMRFPDAVIREIVRKGREPRSQTVITFFADTGLDELETHRTQAATTILEHRLRDILREQLGGTYSVGVGYSNTAPQPGYGTVSVQFGSAPENVETLTAAVMTEIERLRREGPTEADVAVVREGEKNDLVEALRENGYWLSVLQTGHLLGRDPLAVLRRGDRTESLTPENVHAAIRKYFPAGRHTVVTLMPEEDVRLTR